MIVVPPRAEGKERAADRRARVLGAPSLDYLADILARSGCNLSSDSAIIEAFVASGIRPSDVTHDWTALRERAAELRKSSHV